MQRRGDGAPGARRAAARLRPRLRVEARGEIALGPGKADLLEAITETGSIRAAAERLGMSYARAWQLVRAMNRSFTEPLVETARGGGRHGGSRLSPTGARALALYRAMEEAAAAGAARAFARLERLLRKR